MLTLSKSLIKTFSTVGGATYTRPDGITNVDVLLVAGGGGPGSSSRNDSGYGGGGGIVYKKKSHNKWS